MAEQHSREFTTLIRSLVTSVVTILSILGTSVYAAHLYFDQQFGEVEARIESSRRANAAHFGSLKAELKKLYEIRLSEQESISKVH